ncbi:antirestriction protein [Rhizobium sp. Root1203]|uniref:ArdC family protein n=1 Tax=Rhizobium sp. Root1203 TaxID=1736427 RepID=UPI00070D8005|nr:zincin-like metallopeptidase domain-containing protein [Rhizobium sp. Root1203]KQV17081.1 antirestriction protein [Rhizobium sp. Root1203]
MSKSSTKTTAPRSDVYERVTAAIVAKLEQGTRPWMQPWGAGQSPIRPLRYSGVAYRGINTVLLWMTAAERGLQSVYWMTYSQAQELGAQVRKGEKSSLVVYSGAIEKKEDHEEGREKERRIPFLKGYSVFCADQIEGLPEHFYAKPGPDASDKKDRLKKADAFFSNLGADIREGGNNAFYSPTGDFIQMPHFNAFVSAEAHATTLAHEAIHWTKAKSRLDRDFGRKSWGDEGYAREELVAELGSGFFAADLGLSIEPRDDHAAYIKSWLSVLKNDKRAIFQAASFAEKAVTYLHDLQPKRDERAGQAE